MAATALIVTAFTISAVLLERRRRCRSSRARVTQLWIYPIKSCKGIRVTEAVTATTGLKYDRLFMVVDGNLKFVSQRSYPKLG